MKIKLRADSVEIEGYVNAIERFSRPLGSRFGQFIERISKGAFKRALRRNNDVRILLNHKWNRDLGGTADGNLELEEDAIGLHARATITDAEVVEKARAGKLVGWSFGFNARSDEQGSENGMATRIVHDLDLLEVSLIDTRMRPAYEGTLVSVRAGEDGEEQIQHHSDPFCDEVEIVEDRANEQPAGENEGGAAEKPVDKPVEKSLEKNGKVDYTKYRNIINGMKGVK